MTIFEKFFKHIDKLLIRLENHDLDVDKLCECVLAGCWFSCNNLIELLYEFIEEMHINEVSKFDYLTKRFGSLQYSFIEVVGGKCKVCH